MASDKIILGIGGTMFLFAVLVLCGVMKLDQLTLMGFTVAALIFTLADVFNDNGSRIQAYLKGISYFLAVLSLVGIPNLYSVIRLEIEVLSRINDVSLLLSLGIVMWLMYKRSKDTRFSKNQYERSKFSQMTSIVTDLTQEKSTE